MAMNPPQIDIPLENGSSVVSIKSCVGYRCQRRIRRRLERWLRSCTATAAPGRARTDDGEFVLLTNGFAKKSQKTPKQEIELAEQRKADYLSRKGGKYNE